MIQTLFANNWRLLFAAIAGSVTLSWAFYGSAWLAMLGAGYTAHMIQEWRLIRTRRETFARWSAWQNRRRRQIEDLQDRLHAVETELERQRNEELTGWTR